MSFEVNPGETLAVVGESGSGKSVTALSILKLVPQPPGRIVEGRILFKGRDLVPLTQRADARDPRQGNLDDLPGADDRAQSRSTRAASRSSRRSCCTSGSTARAGAHRAIEMLERVGIPAAAQRVDEYPHQLSGGMRQRVMIAMALACQPAVLIADEPTTALDVTIQAQILELLKELQREMGMAVILITHDLGVVAETADRVAVMYGGQVVEYADVRAAFRTAAASLHCGAAGVAAEARRSRRPAARHSGTVPNPARFPAGCRFHPAAR